MALVMRDERAAGVARFWNRQARAFDAIYSGQKGTVGRALDRWLRADMYERLAWVLDRAGDVQGKSICDIGCGSGRFVEALARRGADVVGVDVAPEMIRLAERLVTENGVAPRCRFVTSDVLDWTTDATFDLTLAIGFWDYIPDPAARLARIRSLTRGRFLSTWPRLWTVRMPPRRVRLALRGCPVYFYRRRQVTSLLEAAGFRVDRVQVIGALYGVEATAV